MIAPNFKSRDTDTRRTRMTHGVGQRWGTILLTLTTSYSFAVPDALVDELHTAIATGMADAINAGLIAGGSAIVVTKNKVLLREGYDHAELATGSTFAPDKAVVLASVTKPIVATAAAGPSAWVSFRLMAGSIRICRHSNRFR